MKKAIQALLAILVGNLFYFSVASHLPFPFGHATFRFDPGLVLDFLICLGIYGILRAVWR